MTGAFQDAGDLTELLDRAMRRGIITVEQLDALVLLARSDTVALPHDDERLRFVSGFADIFATIGIGMFLGAVAWFTLKALPPAPAMAALAALSWLLAEFFTRRRRMALPSIALLASFLAASGAGVAAALTDHLSGIGLDTFRLFGWSGEPVVLSSAALATTLLAVPHYWRFRVPITVAAGAAALVATALALVDAASPGFFAAHTDTFVATCGLFVFALAMRFDLADPRRTRRSSDIAFWLHLLAAPLIVHPVLGLIGGRNPSLDASGAILAAVLVLAGIALLVDRRALLVSGLVYAGFALVRLVRESGLVGESLPLTLLLLGAFVLSLSAGWHLLRRFLLRLLPASAAARLPMPKDLR